MYTLRFIVGNMIPQSVKCIHSATKNRKVITVFRAQGFQEVVSAEHNIGAVMIRMGFGDIFSCN